MRWSDKSLASRKKTKTALRNNGKRSSIYFRLRELLPTAVTGIRASPVFIFGSNAHEAAANGTSCAVLKLWTASASLQALLVYVIRYANIGLKHRRRQNAVDLLIGYAVIIPATLALISAAHHKSLPYSEISSSTVTDIGESFALIFVPLTEKA